ncbi:MAG TPA: FapA family protein [Spirochaetota bacterium]|nr:FapA family protein [Spirochaetota bacterium]HOM37556.1 FapA family protein [Spirochaetota bacterium]
MFLIFQEPQEKDKWVKFFSEYFKDQQLLVFDSILNAKKAIESDGKEPSVIVFFLFNNKGIEEVSDFYNLLNSKNIIFYSVIFSMFKDFSLENLCESIIYHPFKQDEIIKEIKKGINFINHIKEDINISINKLDDIASSNVQDLTSKKIFYFDTELIGINKYLHYIENGQKGIYSKISSNFVWKGKVIIKNVSSSGIYYDYDYFEYDDSIKSLVAKKMGFIEYKFGKLEFYPAFKIKEDRMHAYGFITPIETDINNAMEIISQGLEDYGIKAGINYDLIKDIYVKASKEKEIYYIEVAEGKTPEDGYPEYIELIKKKPEYIGKIVNEKTEQIDYHEHSNFLNVTKGTLIAKLIPAKIPIDGYYVSGEKIAAKMLRKEEVIIGENIEFDKTTGNYIASIDGMLVFKKREVALLDTLVIKGDLDIKVGNIHSNKNVIVEGNVMPDMLLEAKGNIVVKGTVEDAKVVGGADVFIRGLTGNGKTWVFSKGDLRFEFCQNSHVEALGNIYFKKYILSSQVYTNGIIQGEDNSKVFNSFIEAAKGADLFEVGNDQFVKNTINLGVNFYTEKIISKLIEKINILKKNEEKIIDILKELIRLDIPLKDQLPRLSQKDRVIVVKNVEELKKLKELIHKLDTTFAEKRKEVQQEFNAVLKIRGRAFPNTTIFIAGLSKKLNDIAKSKKFMFSVKDAEIIETNL